MTDQPGATRGAPDARADTYSLSLEASIQAHLQIAKKAIASSENDQRRAAKHIAEARKQGASQRRIAAAIGKSVSTVNRYLVWHDSGYRDETPFGQESKAKRQRARVRATERTKSRARSPREGEQDELVAALARAQAAQAEAAKTKADAERLVDQAIRLKADAIRLKAEALREQIRADVARARARAAGATFSARSERPLQSGVRKLLVKALGMLGSDHAGERANAASVAEKQRARIGMTWDELLIPASDSTSSQMKSHSDEAVA